MDTTISNLLPLVVFILPVSTYIGSFKLVTHVLICGRFDYMGR